jgi:4-amino-4-deoxy-L-arabinose transferase-like glycosyltransferase
MRVGRLHITQHRLLLAAIVLLAFGLRIWRLDGVPPGWRDDELINSLVISQKVLDGIWAVYYPDASGHEALFHILNAAMLALFGPGAAGIRLLPAMLGTLAVPLTYLLGRWLFGRPAGLLAAAALTLSFWSLMYSRIGLRHVSLPIFALASYYFVWRALQPDRDSAGRSYRDFALGGFFMGLGFYTYFASRGMPVVLFLLVVYLWLFQRRRLAEKWRGLLLAIGLAAILAVPLLATLARQPESEARVAELAVPLTEALAGNLAPLGEHVAGTVGMFHSTGDDEWLYNIPGRPLFGPLGALFFWLGVAIAVVYASRPPLRALLSRGERAAPAWLDAAHPWETAGAFLLIWWLVGISPGFVSVPPASLGHTILAQPAVFLLAALPVGLAAERLRLRPALRRPALAVLGLVLLLSIGLRDLNDYFSRWPERGMTRFLYRAGIKDVADYLHQHPELADFGISGLLAGPWDRLALAIDLPEDRAVRPRWFHPERAIFLNLGHQPALAFIGSPVSPPLSVSSYLPLDGQQAGAYQLALVSHNLDTISARTCFDNGLCLVLAEYDEPGETLALTWEAARAPDLPPMPLISNPPPPGVYTGPRLSVFAHLVGAQDELLAADDGLWVDPVTLQPGDMFQQHHRMSAAGGVRPQALLFGLYDPMTGERILTETGLDYIRLALEG